MDKTILLVNDDRDIGETLEAHLTGAGYLVLPCQDGQEAIDQIERGIQYHLGLVDLSLPKRSGDEVIQTSKRVNPSIPIISISGYFHKPRGADYHIHLPLDYSKILEIVKRLVQNQSSK